MWLHNNFLPIVQLDRDAASHILSTTEACSFGIMKNELFIVKRKKSPLSLTRRSYWNIKLNLLRISSNNLYLSKYVHGSFIGKNNNTRTVQAESSKFASVLFDQGFQIWVGWNWSERHLSVFCIDPIVPGFVLYYVNVLTYIDVSPGSEWGSYGKSWKI